MSAQTHYASTFFLIAVDISAKLNAVVKEAGNISLEAMNAKALVARAGDHVRTFKPISDFMVSLSADTLLLVEKINEEARSMTILSLDGLKDMDALDKFHRAQIMAANAPYEESFKEQVDYAQKDLIRLDQIIQAKSRRLSEYLEEIEHHMLAVQVATSTSRLEAARVSELYRGNFENIAFKFDQAAKMIRKTVLDCQRILNEGRLDQERKKRSR